MKYIIMCGGGLGHWERPRHLTFVNNERIVARTIRLLKQNGITDIAISSNNPEFVMFSVPVITNMNKDCWVDAFVPEDGPVCYICGDVVFSDKAIKKIVETETEDIEFFASSPPFSRYYIKPWAEPFAFKVVNQKHLKEAIQKTKEYEIEGLFKRRPIAWELWQVIKGTELNKIDYSNYTAINDYTCDIDEPEDIRKLERAMQRAEGNI